MSLKVKLISCISLFMLMIGVLIIGVFAATQENISISGNVSFVVADKSLWLEKVTYQEAGGDEQEISTFTPGYINGNFDIDIGNITDNQHGSFNLNFYLVNVLQEGVDSVEWAISNVTIPDTLTGVSYKTNGVVGIGTTTADDLDAGIPPTIDGVLSLTIIAPNTTSLDLSGIVVTIDEYIDAAVQVTSVSASGATTDTYNDLAGGVAIDGSLDLSSIEFATGETTLTISMTSLSAKYIKNKVSWVNTSGVTISSTSLYLPQNSSEQLTGGQSRDLKITVNNTGSTTTISGLEVEFEEKEDLLQVTEEGEPSTYTEEGYWYVEMGTYSTTTDNAEGKRESEYLRWRYFSDGESHYTFDSSTAPTGTGYFILETYNSQFANSAAWGEGGLDMSWNNEFDYTGSTAYHVENGLDGILANDYATSTVRQYINGNNVYKSFTSPSSNIYKPGQSSTYSNMYTDLNIDPENDIVYTQIIGRALSDLYTNMGCDGNSSSPTFNNVDFPDLTNADPGYQYEKTDIDKFWLLSYYEAYHLLSNDAATSSSTDREWGGNYRLRSPFSSDSGIAYLVTESGDLLGGNVIYNDYAARAAFKFSI